VNKRHLAIVSIGFVSMLSSPANAGLYTDDLSRCLVSAASPKDKLDLIQWIYAAIGANTSLQSKDKYPPEQIKKIDDDMAQLFESLVLDRCRKQGIDAIRYEGTSALENSFRILGEIAMKELMKDPAVNKAVGAFAENIDEKQFSKFLEEAGAKP
jgi:hypothetical protein